MFSLIALALASQSVSKATWVDVCSERDSPRACARAMRRWDRIAYKVCGPDGMVDWDGYPGKPACNRSGWDGRRYHQKGAE